ncbi:MAG TPA: M20 family metallopeptidase [Gemmatimonadaceae bacterium]|nr:M20 family metallopeptidase [Gemmatimonadaceae bacterium]
MSAKAAELPLIPGESESAPIPRTLQDRLIALRRELHRQPELAFMEERTGSVLLRELAALSPRRIERVARTGVVARIAGRRASAPVVAIRGDIDALPIQEATGLPFTSANTGVMHACGHDVHATWAVGAAALLTAQPAEGDVVIVLQPAEETGEGALAVLESGALDGVSAIFGGHVDRRFTVGQVVAQPGPLAASADNFDIELVGRGAHGARPHESADPIVGMAALITSLQTIVSRSVNPALPAVVTVGMVSAGSAPNIIPDRATVRGTLRATDDDTRALLQTQVRNIAEHVAAAHKLEARVTIGSGVPPVINSEEAATWAREAAIATLGPDAVVPLGAANMAAEDFAWYLQKIPGCFLRFGARRPGEPVIPAHSPNFDVAEEAILVGARVLAESARRASAALSKGAA